MSATGEFGNPLRKFKLVFLGEQSGGNEPPDMESDDFCLICRLRHKRTD